MKLKATATVFGSAMVVIAFFQILNLFIAQQFPKLEAGFIFTLFNLAKLVNLIADFGSATFYKREIAIAAPETNRMNNIITTRYLCSVLVIAVAALAAMLYFRQHSPYMVAFVFGFHLLEQCNNFLIALMQARNRFKAQLYSIVIFLLVFFVVVLPLWLMGKRQVETIVWSLIIGGIAQNIYLLRSAGYSAATADISLFFQGLRQGYQIGLFELMSSLGPRLIPIILFHRFSYIVSAFSLVNMIIAGLVLVPAALFAANYTDIIAAHREGSNLLKRQFKLGTLFFIGFGLVIATFMYFFFADIIRMVMANKYSTDLEQLRFYFFVIPFTLLNSFQNLLLLAFGKNQQVMKINFFQIMASTLAFLLLLHWYGLVTALISYIVAEWIFALVRLRIVSVHIRQSQPQWQL